MDLTIVIVNYNVSYFLEQCLNSVIKALKNIEGEVFVVDNNSIDNSVTMVKEKFKLCNLIENKENVGFSRANNQAIINAKGKYILLLNPDTIVEENTFSIIVKFMELNPNAGGLGVRMLDGKGKFLPESKRGLPTPMVAFYKIFGFSRLFPKTKRFGQYHLSFLSEFETHKVDVLSGAFMLIRKSVLDTIGLLDESFFMYGEDIDLSYRIKKAGYDNYYLPETSIIHYKGESTKKSSINYVFVFYRAMIIFAQKHFQKKNAGLFSFFIHIAIYFRATLAILNRFIKKTFLIASDYFLLFISLTLLCNYWQYQGIIFPDSIYFISIPLYALIWIISHFYSGSYDKPILIKNFFFGSVFGLLILLLIYGLLPKEYQFSRLYLLIGSVWSFFYFLISRWYFSLLFPKIFSFSSNVKKRFIIVGEKDETERVQDFLYQIYNQNEGIFTVSSTTVKNKNDIGILSQLDQLIEAYLINEVIFCAKNISSHEIITTMSKLEEKEVDFKIAQAESPFLIGSNSIETSGELYIVDINKISKKQNIRWKRTFDHFISLIFLLFSPIFLFFYNNKRRFLLNMLFCLIGEKSIVGYEYNIQNQAKNLPKIKRGILSPLDSYPSKKEISIDKINWLYARDYTIWKDWKILKNSWKKLDKF